jgi:glycosyltransferase involved in cell wall biosynthesis
MKKKRLIIIFWDLGIGGVCSRLIGLAELLNKRTDVSVYFLLKRRIPSKSLEKRFKHIHFKYFSDEIYKGKQILFFFWLLATSLRLRPTHMLGILPRFGLVLAMTKFISSLIGRKIFVTFNQPIGTEKYLKQYELRFIWVILMRWIVHTVDRIIVPSLHNKDELISLYKAKPSNVFQVNSFVTNINNINKLNTKYDKQYDFIFIGRFSEEKGLDTLVQTMLEYRKHKSDFKCVLLGSGPQEIWLRDQIDIHDLNKNVDYLGYSAEPRSYLSKSRLLVLPSFNEGIPIVLLEAFAEGVPVAVTPFDGVKEVVKHGLVGIIAERDSFAKEVSKLLQDSKRLFRYSKKTIQFVKTNYSEKNRKRFIDLILG